MNVLFRPSDTTNNFPTRVRGLNCPRSAGVVMLRAMARYLVVLGQRSLHYDLPSIPRELLLTAIGTVPVRIRLVAPSSSRRADYTF
jgi:hypothetical protein